MHRRRVPVFLQQVRFHHLKDLGVEGRGGGVIEVDALHQTE